MASELFCHLLVVDLVANEAGEPAPQACARTSQAEGAAARPSEDVIEAICDLVHPESLQASVFQYGGAFSGNIEDQPFIDDGLSGIQEGNVAPIAALLKKESASPVGGSLVRVCERMILDEGIEQRRCLTQSIRVDEIATNGCERSLNSGAQHLGTIERARALRKIQNDRIEALDILIELLNGLLAGVGECALSRQRERRYRPLSVAPFRRVGGHTLFISEITHDSLHMGIRLHLARKGERCLRHRWESL